MQLRSLVHKAPLSEPETRAVLDAIGGVLVERPGYCLIRHSTAPDPLVLERLRRGLSADINPLPSGYRGRDVRLLVTDMDSTLIAIECIDELADMCNLKSEVAVITEAAMRGELDFPSALRRRVSLLEGLPVSALERVYRERLRLNPGAERMLAALRQKGIRVGLVSGGFTFFTERLKRRLRLDFALANVLEVKNGLLTGRVQGDIVGAECKARFLSRLCRELGIDPRQSIAVGDGFNDLEMLAQAGLSVAYRAKPKLREAADIVFDHSDLSGVCHLLEP